MAATMPKFFEAGGGIKLVKDGEEISRYAGQEFHLMTESSS
jgi:hypothetical protein